MPTRVFERWLTEDDGNDNGLDILRTRLVGISGEIGNVETECSVVAQHSVEIYDNRQ